MDRTKLHRRCEQLDDIIADCWADLIRDDLTEAQRTDYRHTLHAATTELECIVAELSI